MKRIYKGQTKLRLFIKTKNDLKNFMELKLWYKKPDNSEGFFIAHIYNETEGIIFYDFVSEDELDISGWWTFWPEIVFDDGRKAFGRAAKIFVYEGGQ